MLSVRCVHLAAGVEVATLAERDHLVNKRPHSARADKGGLNSSVPDDLGGECAEECLALISWLAKLRNPFAVADHLDRCSARSRADGQGSGVDDRGARPEEG